MVGAPTRLLYIRSRLHYGTVGEVPAMVLNDGELAYCFYNMVGLHTYVQE